MSGAVTGELSVRARVLIVGWCLDAQVVKILMEISRVKDQGMRQSAREFERLMRGVPIYIDLPDERDAFDLLQTLDELGALTEISPSR